MKIHLNQKDNQLLKTLLETKENNIQISMMMSYLLENIDLFSKDEIIKYQNNFNCSLSEAYFHYAIDIWELDYDNKENQKIFNDYLTNSFKECDENIFKENPYYKNVKIKEIKNKNYALFYDHYKAYEPFPLDDISLRENYLEKTTFGFFKNDFPFLCLNLNNTTWMSITPNEINTMKNSILKASGNVLVLGLGLGYFPYMISLKNDVKNIEIVEKDLQITDIFENSIYPNFENKEKIKLIKDNAFNVINKSLNKYDFVYVDLYHNPVDALPIYIKIKHIENKNKVHFEYWLEDGILAYLRRLVITIIQESLEGYNDKKYQNYSNQEDQIINEIYFKTKDLIFNSFEEIIDFLKNDSLKKLTISLF